jgi:hypothetical protein
MNVGNYIRRCEHSALSPYLVVSLTVMCPRRLQHHPPGAVLCLRAASCSTLFNSCCREKKPGYRRDTEPEG